MDDLAIGSAVRDLYAGGADGWATGAELVYLPLARALVDTSPDSFDDQVVLDAGAGTGAGTRALRAVGARPVAIDFVYEMLARDRANRPPAAVADLLYVPLRSDAVDAAIAPFVLNHLVDPLAALRELARVVRPGGVVLASTFSEKDRPPVKDLIDGVAARHGWSAPASYAWIKEKAMPLLAGRDEMARAASDAGLTDLSVIEEPIDVGVRAPEDLVRYRFGQGHLVGFLAGLSDAERASVFDEAVAAVRASHDGSAMAPTCVFLAARAAA